MGNYSGIFPKKSSQDRLTSPVFEYQPVQKKDNAKFKTVENVTGNNSTISPNKSWKFTDYKEKKLVKNYDRLKLYRID